MNDFYPDFDPQKAFAQLDTISHYPIELSVHANELLALIHIMQHLQQEKGDIPSITCDLVRNFAQRCQILLADPTTDFGKMIQAGWATPPDQALPPSAATAAVAHILQTANRTSVFALAEHLETAFHTYSTDHPMSNADIIMGLQNFHLWIIFYLEKNTGHGTTLRKAILDTFAIGLNKTAEQAA